MSNLYQPMRRMVSSLVLAGLVAGGGAALAAPGHEGGPHHRGMERMHKSLELSDSQREQLRNLRQQQREPLRELAGERRELHQQLGEYARSGSDDAARLQQLAERMGDVTRRQVILATQQRSAFYATLDDTQREKLDSQREQRREQWREKRKERGADKPHRKMREHHRKNDA